MKNSLKIVLIIVSILIGIILIYALQARIFDKRTFSKEEDKMENIKVIINDKIYNATIIGNETSKKFIEYLPIEFNMTELNGNEKYVYMDYTLPTDIVSPKHINAGDIMLYGNNCLVIFYKSFDTNYSYTKIGHIDNLIDLGNSNVTVKFEK